MWELWGKLQMIQSLRKMCGALLVQGCFAEAQQSACPCSETGTGTVLFSPPAAGPALDGPLAALQGGEFITRTSSRSPTSSADLYARSSSPILKKITSEGSSRSPPLFTSPPAAPSGLPHERQLKPNAFSFSSSTSVCCLKCTL